MSFNVFFFYIGREIVMADIKWVRSGFIQRLYKKNRMSSWYSMSRGKNPFLKF